MSKFFSVMLLAFAVSTPAYADVFGIFSSNRGPEHAIDGHVYAPAQNVVVDGSMHGYPFYSGCCEPKTSCFARLWDGYCGSKFCGMKGCGMKAPRVQNRGGLKGGCGCDTGCGIALGHSNCGKGGFGYGPYQRGGKSSRPEHVSYRGFGGKGGCGFGASCGGKGCDTCAPCGPKPCRLGLFDWLHFGHGHRCDLCGGVDCDCHGSKGRFGKGGFSKGGYIEQAPIQGFDKSYYNAPTEPYEESTLQPPAVLVEPTSDRSAWRREVPMNPLVRPFSY